jgi:hypothetical protein
MDLTITDNDKCHYQLVIWGGADNKDCGKLISNKLNTVTRISFKSLFSYQSLEKA